jgi:hypothetical protein
MLGLADFSLARIGRTEMRTKFLWGKRFRNRQRGSPLNNFKTGLWKVGFDDVK